MGVTRESAEQTIAEFNAYYETLSERERQAHYGGKPASMARYEKCFRCGGPWQNTRPTREGDCPDGVTLQPILYEPG
jgi:hypothetical protein